MVFKQMPLMVTFRRSYGILASKIKYKLYS